MSENNVPTTIDLCSLAPLCETLRSNSRLLQQSDAWPQQSLRACAKYEVFRWFLPTEFGGIGAAPHEIVRGYIELASACLTTTFVISQRTAACKRILASANQPLKQRLLPQLAEGSLFSTCLLYTSPSPRDQRGSRMPSSA